MSPAAGTAGAPAAGVDRVARTWLAAVAVGRLVLQRCSACDAVQHPPTALCRACGSASFLEWLDAGGHGHIDAATLVQTTPFPERASLLPYWILRVRLAEGAHLFGNLEGAGTAIRSNLGTCVVWSAEHSAERGCPVFVSASACAGPPRSAS